MDGIIIATDREQEWLLPWWWRHYSQTNSYPVTLFDLGMSPEAKGWSQERFKLVAWRSVQVFSKEEIPAERRKKWEKKRTESFWKIRPAWMQKPFLLNQSPYERTVWLDLDCQVRSSIEPLFECLRFGVEIGIMNESLHSQKPKLKKGGKEEPIFNSGVISYLQNARFLRLWKEIVEKEHVRFIGDQEALSEVLIKHQIPHFELPPYFNWRLKYGIEEKAHILHYSSFFWKMAILKSLKPDLGDNPTLPPLFDRQMG